MADKDFLERILSMLTEDFQDIYVLRIRFFFTSVCSL